MSISEKVKKVLAGESGPENVDVQPQEKVDVPSPEKEVKEVAGKAEAEAQEQQQVETKTTAQIMRERAKMTKEQLAAEDEKINKTDSPGNRCSYCGDSFNDQITLSNHQQEKHKDENKL